MKNATIRIDDDIASFLEKEGGSINQSIIACIKDLQQLRLVSSKELKGKFTDDEWKFFADSLNGSMVTDIFRVNASYLVAHNEDSQLYEKTADKWNIDLKELNKKCSSLTGAQVDALYRRVELFWEMSANVDLNEWAKY